MIKGIRRVRGREGEISTETGCYAVGCTVCSVPGGEADFRARQREAFTAAFERHRRRLLRIAAASQFDPDDAVQGVAERILANGSYVAKINDWFAFMAKTLGHIVLKLGTQEAGRQALQSALCDSLQTYLLDPERKVVGREMLRVATADQTALVKALVDVHIWGDTLEQAAARQGVSYAALRKQASRKKQNAVTNGPSRLSY